MRLFVAIVPPEDIKQQLQAYPLPSDAAVKPHDRDKYHLTLSFLGDQNINLIERALSNITFNTFKLTLAGTGYFALKANRSGKRNHILWAGLMHSEPLYELQQLIDNELKEQGIRVDSRPYRPHITLARVNRGLSDKLLSSFLSFKLHTGAVTSKKEYQNPSFYVDEIALFSSEATIEGKPNRYCCLQRFKLITS